MIRHPGMLLVAGLLLGLMLDCAAYAQAKPDCSALPDHNRLKTVLQAAVKGGAEGQRRHGKPGMGGGRKS